MITDQRFIIENQSVQELDHNTIIHIIRPGTESSNHASEKELVKLFQKKQYDYIINNDGTLEDLFNKCKEIVYS